MESNLNNGNICYYNLCFYYITANTISSRKKKLKEEDGEKNMGGGAESEKPKVALNRTEKKDWSVT